jgi:hypothetical protein
MIRMISGAPRIGMIGPVYHSSGARATLLLPLAEQVADEGDELLGLGGW